MSNTTSKCYYTIYIRYEQMKIKCYKQQQNLKYVAKRFVMSKLVEYNERYMV